MVTIYIVLLAVGVLAVVWGICHYFDSSTKETHVLYKEPKKSPKVSESSCSNSNNDFLYVAAAIEIADTSSDFFDFD